MLRGIGGWGYAERYYWLLGGGGGSGLCDATTGPFSQLSKKNVEFFLNFFS